MLTRLTFYNKKIHLTLFKDIHILQRSIHVARWYSFCHHQSTHVTVPQRLIIIKRFMFKKTLDKGKECMGDSCKEALQAMTTVNPNQPATTQVNNTADNLQKNPDLQNTPLPLTEITQPTMSPTTSQPTPKITMSSSIKTGQVTSLQKYNNSSQEQFSTDNTSQDQPVKKPFTDLVNTTDHNAWTSQKGTGVDFSKPEFQESKKIVIDFNNSEPITQGFALARKMDVSKTVISSEEVQEAINLFKETKPNDLKQALNVLKDMTPKKSSMILTQDSPSVVRAKLSIQHFVQGLKRYKNDQEFIQNWIKAMEEHSHSMTRAFQVAMEITFSKRKFSAEALTEVIKDIDLYTVGDSNSNTIDSSTLYTALQTYYIGRAYPVESVVVLAPGTDTANLKKVLLSPKDQELLQQSAQATGNTICDLKFFDHYYDCKSNNYRYRANHIFMLDSDEILHSQKVRIFLNQLLKDFQQTVGLTVLEKEYLERTIKKLDYILKDTNSNFMEKLDEWNAYVFLTLERRPTTILFPLMIPASRDPVVKELLDPAIDKMIFPLKKALETFDLKKILQEIYSRMTQEQLKDVNYITRGAYEEDDL